MSEPCFNTLHIKGESDNLSDFFGFINKTSDLGNYFLSLEKALEDCESDLDLPFASQKPWIDTFSIDNTDKSISWESRGYPSVLAVYELSKKFPDLNFILDIDNREEEIAGYISISNGDVLDYHQVDFDDACDNLLSNYGNEILSLRKGDRIEVGLGMVQVVCSDEEDNEDEVIKTFNLIFQCDPSPKIIVHIAKDPDVPISLDMNFTDIDWDRDWLNIEYSDDDGNDGIYDNPCHREMCLHSEKPSPR